MIRQPHDAGNTVTLARPPFSSRCRKRWRKRIFVFLHFAGSDGFTSAASMVLCFRGVLAIESGGLFDPAKLAGKSLPFCIGKTVGWVSGVYKSLWEWWLDPELNWGHKDFQSSALPTELSSQTMNNRENRASLLNSQTPTKRSQKQRARFAVRGQEARFRTKRSANLPQAIALMQVRKKKNRLRRVPLVFCAAQGCRKRLENQALYPASLTR
jgi:hypothetical protein